MRTTLVRGSLLAVMAAAVSLAWPGATSGGTDAPSATAMMLNEGITGETQFQPCMCPVCVRLRIDGGAPPALHEAAPTFV